MWRNLNNLLPNSILKKFKYDRNCSLNNDLENPKLVIPYMRTKTGKSFLKRNGSVVWNNIPTDIKKSTSYKIFKTKLKKHLLEH